jgi:hypothetical protein
VRHLKDRPGAADIDEARRSCRTTTSIDSLIIGTIGTSRHCRQDLTAAKAMTNAIASRAGISA